MKNKIAFPGLGIGEFTVNEVAFTIFGRDVAWYGVIIAIGMVIAVGYIMWRTTQYKGIKPDDVIDFALFVIVFGVIGARLYYVIFDPTPSYHSFIDVIAIWEGGLAIYGGIIAGAITAIIVCLVKKIHIPCFFDMLAPAVMIAQSIGRWGNFVNGEAYGGVTDIFIRMELNGVCVHPTFLYESLWNLVGFILLNVFYNKRKFDGQIVLGYLTWYGLGRGFIEGLRTDSLYIGPLRVSQLVGFISFAVALGIMIYFLITKKAPKYASASYREGADEENTSEGNFDISQITDKVKGFFARFKKESKNENNSENNETSSPVNGDSDKKENENGTDN